MTSILSSKSLMKSQSSNDLFQGYFNPFSNKETHFTKINNYIIPNTNGIPPEILYYKDSNCHPSSLYKFNYGNSGGFISDGGLNKKYNKFISERSLINSKSMAKLQTIHSSNNISKTLTKEVYSKSMKNIRKNNNQTPLYESKINSLKKNKYYTSSSRSSKNIFSLKNKINKNHKIINNKKKTDKKVKTEKNNNINQKEKNEKNEEEKYEKMNKLIEDKIASYIRDLKNNKKPSFEEERNEKKQKVLAENGIEIRIDSTIDDEPKEEDENNFVNEKIEEEKLSSNNLNSQSTKYYVKSKRTVSPKINNLFLEENIKKQYKPRIDSFEYINILKNLEGSIRENNNNKLAKSNSTTKIFNNHLDNSFRLSNSNLNQKKIYSNDSTNNLFSKKNIRKKEELDEFNRKKKEIKRRKNEQEEIEKNNKDLINFRNLYNLNLCYLNLDNNNNTKNVKKEKKKEKIKNEYYVGTDSKTESTIIDPNEYFLDILESQQLIVNGGLYKIDNLNISKSQIKKITDKESKRLLTDESESSESKTNELKEKVNQSIIQSQNIMNKVKESQNKNNEKKLKEKEKEKSLKKELETFKDKEIKIEKNKEIEKEIKKEKEKEIKPEIKKELENQKLKLEKQKEIELQLKKDLEDTIFPIVSNEQKEKIIHSENRQNKLLIETNNNPENETNSNLTSKEKNLPSLSHTYTSNTNPNEKVVIEIEPRAVLNLVEIIKLLMQRKVFYTLYEVYINEAISQRYTIAFAFFVAICKQYSFRKIEEYSNYKTYYYAFLQLFRPFMKINFRYFVNCCFTKKKIEYFVELLSRMFKFKTMERIYIYCQIVDGDEERAFKQIFTKIMKVLMKPKLREAFNHFITNILQITEKDSNNNNNLNNSNNSDRNKYIKENLKNSPTTSKEKKDNKNNSPSSNNNKENINLNKKPDHEIKMNSFIYESFESSKSSLTVEPNSVDNEKLHKLHIMLFEKRHQIMNYNNNNDLYDNSENNNSFRKSNNNTPSHKSAVSVKEISKMKPGLNLSKTLSNISNENLNDSIKKSIESNKSLQKNASNKSLKDLKNNSGNISKNSIDYNNDEDNKVNNTEEQFEEMKNNLKPQNEDKKVNNNKDDEIPSIFEKEDDNIDDKNAIDGKNFQNEESKNKNLIEMSEKDIKEVNDEANNKNQNELPQNNIILNEQSECEKKIKENTSEEISDNRFKLFPLHSNSEIDISAEKDLNNPNIDWEYSVPIKSDNNLIIKDNENKDKNGENTNNDINNHFFITDKKESIINQKPLNQNLYEENLNNNIEIEDKEKNNEKINKKLNENIKDEEEKESKIFEEKKGIKEEIKQINKKDDNRKNSYNTDEDYLGDFENISDIEKEDEHNNNQNIISIIKSEIKQNDKSRNNLPNHQEQNKEINKPINNDNYKDNIQNNLNQIEKTLSNNIINEEINYTLKTEDSKNISNEQFQQINSEKLANSLVEEIILNLINSEIKSPKVNLFPKRENKFDPFSGVYSNISKSGSLANSNNSFKEILPINKDINLKDRDANTSMISLSNSFMKDNNSFQQLNESLMSSYSAYSIFNKTMKDIKKEHSLNFYMNKIAPQLIKLIRNEIKEKYNEIYDNISTPLKNHSNGLMISLALQDADMLRENYKKLYIQKEIFEIFDGEKILKNFQSIYNQLIEKENIKNEEIYHYNLNQCLIDTTIELLNKERFYGGGGEPLPWSSRTHNIIYKYDKKDCKKLCDYITYNLFYLLYNRIGLISENYDFLTSEQLNNERERRIIKTFKKELDENENQWKNLEMEETQLKIEVSEMIMDQLYNEIIEILEHIQYSRKRPDLYQNKSIYGCEEIPKLSFQVTSSGNVEEDENDLINI